MNARTLAALALAITPGLQVPYALCEEQAETPPETLPLLEGERSVVSELEDVFEEGEPILGTRARSWFDWKDAFRERTGIAFGIAALSLYQRASDSRDEKDGWGQRYRVNFSRGFRGSSSRSVGRINARVEYRASVPNYLAPTELSRAIGARALNTGAGYPNDFDLDVSVLNWTRSFADDAARFAIGRLSSGSYIDDTPIDGLTGGFQNGALNGTPAFSGPGAGSLGFVAKGNVVGGFWLGAHIYDANAVSGEFNDDVFDDNEWLKAAEVGWTPSPERFATDRVTVTYWDKDERKERGIRGGHGWIATVSYQPWNNVQSFARYGHSNGGGGARAENALSAGIDWKFLPGQAWALGAAWAEPTSRRQAGNPRDEYVIETSYRFRLVRAVQLMLNAQLLLDPANNTNESSTWVIGLRTAVQL